MCKLKDSSKRNIATQDINSYALVTIKYKLFNNLFPYILYNKKKIKLGKTYSSDLTTNHWDNNLIIIKALFSFKSIHNINEILIEELISDPIINKHYLIIQCTIPTGAEYFEDDKNFASNKLIFNSII